MQCLSRSSSRLGLHKRCSTTSRQCSTLRAPRSRTPMSVNALFGIFGKKKEEPVVPVIPKRETIIPEPSFNLPAGCLALSGVSAVGHVDSAAVIFAILGVFLGIQATRVRFRFEDDALEVVIGEQQEESENKFVGGRNRWTYDSFTNWEFWWPNFPVLVYFKETQTKPEGQIHFFPVIFNGKQVYDVMLERCGSTQTSGPKDE